MSYLPFHISHICESITDSLSFTDLLKCIVVNRHWHDTFIPILWSDAITFRTNARSWWALHEYHDYSLHYHGRKGLLNHAHHIRAITCHGFNSLQTLFDFPCRNLVEIHYEIDSTGCPGLDDLVDLMSVNPNLRAVTIDGVDVDDKATETQLRGLLDYLDETPSVTSVSLTPLSSSDPSRYPEKWGALWVRLCSRVECRNIHSLRIYNWSMLRSKRAVSGGRPWPARETPVSVRVLNKPFRRVVPNRGGRWENEQRTQGSSSSCLAVLESNGSLELSAFKFDIWKTLLPMLQRTPVGWGTSDDGSQQASQNMETLAPTLRQFFPNLCSLDIFPWFMTEQALKQFLSNMTGLSSLALFIGSNHVPPLSAMLSFHSHALWSLRINKEITMADCFSIVSSCPKLQSLTIRVLHRMPGPKVSPSWICKDLRKLNLQLLYRSMGSYYLDDDEDTPTFDREIESAKQLAPSLLHQIGTLPSLRDLYLGVNREYVVEESPFFQLSMDRVCGLPQLAGVQQLKTFKVTGLVHSVGQEEIEWMRVHWPSLFSLELPILVDAEDGSGKVAASRETFDGHTPLEYQKWFPGLNILIPENCYGCPQCHDLYCPMDKSDGVDYDYIGTLDVEPVDMEEAVEDMDWDEFEREEAIWALDEECHLSRHHNVHKSGCPPKVSRRQMQCGHRYQS
ncbi:hypothetical protein BGZ59_000011 [Podila verticillata]|nr:hypothetical protein BGZ59_000011 [Podila verticillata]